uniref:52 kDa repressor of the inhibitor of the protein kinase-like n=1 Tax=Diabrotica virgifera virgifera TaxID=50390 RepID=A0A6P7FE29_DIAVI
MEYKKQLHSESYLLTLHSSVRHKHSQNQNINNYTDTHTTPIGAGGSCSLQGYMDPAQLRAEDRLTTELHHSGIEQSSICTRYLDKSDGKFIIREDFLCFITIADFTGKGIGTSYLNFLDSSGLNCTYFLGQGYDGARAVSGEFHGAQAVVRERYPLALYSHCAAHSFNLAVSSACNITAIRNCLGTLESIHTFFIYPKRQNALQDAINEDETLRESRLKKLKKFCKTRWVEQHESVATYLHLQPAVIRALDVISTTWKDPTTSSGAFKLLSAIKTANFQVKFKTHTSTLPALYYKMFVYSSFFEFNFQISMHILSSVHSLTLSLSRVLQSENQDLGEAIELADAAKQVLLERRENAEKDFRGIFKTVSEISAKYDIELRKPRLASKQTQRSNVQTDSVQDYFRITIYIPYIDLRDDSRDIWVDEVKLWRQRIAGKNVKNSLEALDVCNGDAFPNVHQMLRTPLIRILASTSANAFKIKHTTGRYNAANIFYNIIRVEIEI